MHIEDLTIGQAKQLVALFSAHEGQSRHPYEIGKPYLVRTVTMINCGLLKAVYEQEIVLESASWIADTGRFSDALKDISILNEVEPYPGDVIIARGAIVDASIPEWNGQLPRTKK